MSKKVCTYIKNLIPDENLPPNKSRDLLQSYFSFLAISLQACNFTLLFLFYKYYEGNINKKTKSINCEKGGDLTFAL